MRLLIDVNNPKKKLEVIGALSGVGHLTKRSTGQKPNSASEVRREEGEFGGRTTTLVHLSG